MIDVNFFKNNWITQSKVREMLFVIANQKSLQVVS